MVQILPYKGYYHRKESEKKVPTQLGYIVRVLIRDYRRCHLRRAVAEGPWRYVHTMFLVIMNKYSRYPFLACDDVTPRADPMRHHDGWNWRVRKGHVSSRWDTSSC